MKKLLILSVVALAAAAIPTLASTSRAFFGPPLLCFPLDIGDARTIEEVQTPEMFAEARANPAKFVKSVTDVLEQSTDSLVHMETMRRASMVALGSANSDKDRSLYYLLKGELADRALRATLANTEAQNTNNNGGQDSAARTKLNLINELALLDAGYLLEAVREGRGGTASGVEFLERAGALVPGDAAIPFTLAGISFMEDTSLFGKGGTEAARKYYYSAWKKAAEGSRMRENIKKSAIYFLGEKTGAELFPTK